VELTWPVLWITPRFLLVERPVPVLALPWISLPLGERVSGLLAPQLGSTAVTGLSLAQPLFLTLGPTADLTLTPRYDLGRARSDVAAGKPSVRGPGAALEARWAPAEGAAARLQADLLWDLDDEVGALQGHDGARGLRVALTGGWAQRLSAQTSVRADLDLVGDPLYVRDFTPDVLLRDARVRRSALQLAHRREDFVVELSAAWLEPVARSGAMASVDGGLFGGKLPGFHRWPALDATLLPVALAGPLRLSGRAGLARFAPATGDTSDGGADGIGPGERGLQPQLQPAADAGELDHRWAPGERLAATRLDARAELAAPLALGEVVGLTPSLRAAVAGYAFDAARDPLVDAWASAGLFADARLSRRFGEVRHELTPRVEWRFTTGVAGPALPAFGYDGWDRGGATPPGAAAGFLGPRLASAAPPGASSQLRLSLANRLERGGEELLRLELGQELDLRRGGLAEGFLQAGAARGPVSGEVDLRLWTGGGRPVAIDPLLRPVKASWLDAFSELRLRAAVADGRGDELRAGLLAVGAGGSGRLSAGVDDLFDPRPAGAEALASATLAGRVRLGSATVGYDVLLPARTSAVPACVGDGTRLANAWEIQQQVGSMEWDSPCHCFRARVSVALTSCGELRYSGTIDLGRAAAVVGR
jgi:LPS-assembly protein